MATPAQVANDLEASARWWLGRSDYVYDACKGAAKLIRAALAGRTLTSDQVTPLQFVMIEQAVKWKGHSIEMTLRRGCACLSKVHVGDFSDV